MAGEVVPMQPPTPAEEKLAALAGNPNIATELDEVELARIGDLVCREYRIDYDSMETWRERMELGLKLAALEKEEKTYPWPKAANVKYPLVTTAVLMFNAKAYPAVVPGDRVVKAAVHGADRDGKKAARGDRVSAHMSWQLTSKVVEWEEETDKLLTLLPLVGTIFRKTWYDPAWKRIRCRNVLPGKLVLNERVTSLLDAPRCTEELSKYPSEIQEKRLSGEWLDQEYIVNIGDDTAPAQDFLEQHRRIDLDGDGYDEPYIVTVHKDTQKVARIVADFTAEDVVLGEDGKVSAIQRGQYFTPFHFMPSLDGSYFATGFGLLLGDISESINVIINQLLDAGHAASLGGGFIGSDFRIKGGQQRFRPGEWKLANSSGSVIRDSIVPLTFPGADKTLFELLGLLIEAGKEVASVKDVLQGDTGGAQQTATTTLALIEQGMAAFTAAYKRIFRSLKQEYALIARINRDTVSVEEYNRFHDEMEPAPMPPMGAPGQPPQEGIAPGTDPAMMPVQGQMAAPADTGLTSPDAGAPSQMMGHNGPPMQPAMFDPKVEYDMSDMDITPVADPQSVTRMQQAAKAQIVMEAAMNGMADPAEASKRMFEAAGIPDVEELAPKPDQMAAAMAEAEIAEKQAKAAESQLKGQELQTSAMIAQSTAQQAQQELQMKAAEFQAEMQFRYAEMDNQRREVDAKIDLIHAQIEKIMAEIQQGNFGLSLQARQTAVTERKTDADITYKGEEVGLAKRGADRDDFKTKAEVERGGEEIELAKHGAALAEWQAEAGVTQKDAELGIKDRESRKKTFTPAKKAKPEPEAEKKPRKTVTRVTKHDDKGRIIEFVQEDE
jgi:chaperonin GroES